MSLSTAGYQVDLDTRVGTVAHRHTERVLEPKKRSQAFVESAWPRTRSFIAGYASGGALVLAGHPFDTIKVRLQTEGRNGRFKGPINCLRETIKKEGVLAMYKGITPPLLTIGVVNSVMFGLQGITVSKITADPSAPAKISEISTAAVFTGAGISILVAPIEGIKARLQVQYNTGNGAAVYKGPVDCFKQVVRTLGVRKGLYRGWVPTCLSRMSNYAYFGPYEYFRRSFGMNRANEGEKSLVQSMGASIAAGGLAGVCYWISCYPMDVIKNRIQAQPDSKTPMYRNMRDVARSIYRTEGWRGFFTGFTPCVLRAIPANAAAFTAFEIMMRLLPA